MPIRRTLELFAGIGGLRAAWPESGTGIAIDIHTGAQQVYHANFQSPYLIREIESLSDDQFQSFEADLWWMSPPCQPYTRRGNRRDLHDPRAASLLRILEAIDKLRPREIALENVAEFEHSEACVRLLDLFARLNYSVQTLRICPTEMGWPNRRPRFYVLASLDRLEGWGALPQYQVSLADLLEEEPHDKDGDYFVNEATAQQYWDAVDRIDQVDPHRPTACFAKSYGKTITAAGSYLEQGSRLRRFSPREVARLLGFPDTFKLPDARRSAWALLGNSLALPAVRYLVSHLSQGPTCKLPWR